MLLLRALRLLIHVGVSEKYPQWEVTGRITFCCCYLILVIASGLTATHVQSSAGSASYSKAIAGYWPLAVALHSCHYPGRLVRVHPDMAAASERRICSIRDSCTVGALRFCLDRTNKRYIKY